MPMFREVENRGIPCHLFGYILDAEESSGFFENQDIYFSALGDGAAELEIPVAPMHYNSMEIVHGGVFAGLLDSAMGMALLTKNKAGVTTSMSIHYLKSAKKGDVLRARATVVRNGRTMVYCEAKIFNQREELLATGQGAFLVQVDDFVRTYAAKLKKQNAQEG